MTAVATTRGFPFLLVDEDGGNLLSYFLDCQASAPDNRSVLQLTTAAAMTIVDLFYWQMTMKVTSSLLFWFAKQLCLIKGA